MRPLKSLFRTFSRDERGAFATIFGIVLIVVVATAGAVVDFVGIQQARSKGQAALDAATLALQPRIYTWTEDQLIAAAEDLMIERIADDRIEVEIDNVDVDTTAGSLYFHSQMTVPTVFVSLVNVNSMDVALASQAVAGGNDIEVAMVLDVTGSMSGTKIDDLIDASNTFIDLVVKDDQDPYYSRIGLVAYSNSVNVGSAYAAGVRGPVTGAKTITNATWKSGSTKNISGITRASQVVVTSNSHGFANNDVVWISGVSGMTQINSTSSKVYLVSDVTTNTFKLKNASTGAYVNSSTYTSYSSGGTIQKCASAMCRVTVTSNSHGFTNGSFVYITNVSGMTQINSAANTTWTVMSAAANTFVLTESTGGYSNYSSGGNAWCVVAGCTYYRYTSVNGSTRVSQITNCVTERVGGQAYTDAAPTTSYVGRHYPPSASNCNADSLIQPLTANKTELHADINSLDTGGSTAGQIGIAWGWYLLAPNFAYLWPDAENTPAAYNADHLIKVAVIMTDGEFNTMHCNAVPSADSDSAAGSSSQRINCNATNGNAFSQSEDLCDAMRDAGITIYTVGFDLGGVAAAEDVLESCATSGVVLLADDGAELTAAFENIAQSISDLRLSL